MKKLNIKIAALFFGLFIIISFSGCEKEEGLTAKVTINESGSGIGGDVTGDGGDDSKSYTWNNAQTTADWNMDITSVSGGSFQLTIQDGDGNAVVSQTLQAGQGEDSQSGVTSSGAAGEWTIKVNLTDFNGDGSFSISPGD